MNFVQGFFDAVNKVLVIFGLDLTLLVTGLVGTGIGALLMKRAINIMLVTFLISGALVASFGTLLWYELFPATNPMRSGMVSFFIGVVGMSFLGKMLALSEKADWWPIVRDALRKYLGLDKAEDEK